MGHWRGEGGGGKKKKKKLPPNVFLKVLCTPVTFHPNGRGNEEKYAGADSPVFRVPLRTGNSLLTKKRGGKGPFRPNYD